MNRILRLLPFGVPPATTVGRPANTGSGFPAIRKTGPAQLLSPGQVGQQQVSAGASSGGSGGGGVSGGAGGTVSDVATGTGLTGGPITTTGTISLATVADGSILANMSGVTAAPTPDTLSVILDHVFGNARGTIITRQAGGWVTLTPGAANDVLVSGGTAADIVWDTLSGLLDTVFGNAEGDILYRGASAWAVLAAGTAGQLLATGGASTPPSWGWHGVLPLVNGDINTNTGQDNYPGIMYAPDGQTIGVPI
jgi:hypothetical protein